MRIVDEVARKLYSREMQQLGAESDIRINRRIRLGSSCLTIFSIEKLLLAKNCVGMKHPVLISISQFLG